jgi:hypothetical protein
LREGALWERALWERAPPAKGWLIATRQDPRDLVYIPIIKLSGILPAGFAGLSLAGKLLVCSGINGGDLSLPVFSGKPFAP